MESFEPGHTRVLKEELPAGFRKTIPAGTELRWVDGGETSPTGFVPIMGDGTLVRDYILFPFEMPDDSFDDVVPAMPKPAKKRRAISL
jgi:hypothetical protein